MLNRSVPFDLQAERATLGAVLLERDAIIAVAPWLLPELFYLEKHALVYQAMLACYARREPPDLATVAAELRRQEQLDLVGGIAFLGELGAEVPTAVHIEYYARSVERTAILRRLIEAGGKIAALGYEEAPELDQTLDQAEQLVFAIAHTRRLQAFTPLSAVMNDLYRQIEQLQAHEGSALGIPTGYQELDGILGGMGRGDLILLAARPGVGKSALAMQIARHVAEGRGSVGVFSFEMSSDQIGQRLLSTHTGIDLKRLRTGSLRPDELTLAFEGMGVLSELPIFIEDRPSPSLSEVRARSRRLAAESGCDLIIIDYLQLMTGDGENRVQEVSEISRGLKLLARELQCPILALSQLSRAVEQRANKVPQLSDLRDSGALEQDADVVLFIYREELYDKDTDKPGVAEVYIAKHRNGPLGVAPLRFEARTTSFQNIEHYQHIEGY